MKLLDRKITDKINDMITDIVATCSRILSTEAKVDETASYDSKDDAKNRLKLVLMHDRSQLTPCQMEQMREELLDVISRYVEIDREALDLCLESETNTIALVANIPILRAKKLEQDETQEPEPENTVEVMEAEVESSF
ncbi:MAG TPA: cell division topological specificity factor MinE [Candidatus Gastranaerophilales bacterium]|nr:cell division topological specificity factor MinE [Candidatus Gastranaerophilales bacterium]